MLSSSASETCICHAMRVQTRGKVEEERWIIETCSSKIATATSIIRRRGNGEAMARYYVGEPHGLDGVSRSVGR